MKKFKTFIIKHGAKICALAIGITAVAGQACRSVWYEPKEPEGLNEFLRLKR